ncbi:hypothetical protein JW921_10565, partial [Candidatus Fermentibacterales bacterium]|nr:hypothetical protein [Candidatus Fermentibacterales bacterium]
EQRDTDCSAHRPSAVRGMPIVAMMISTAVLAYNLEAQRAGSAPEQPRGKPDMAGRAHPLDPGQSPAEK